MGRSWLIFALGLVAAFNLTACGCTAEPDVTPTPDAGVTQSPTTVSPSPDVAPGGNAGGTNGGTNAGDDMNGGAGAGVDNNGAVGDAGQADNSPLENAGEMIDEGLNDVGDAARNATSRAKNAMR